MFFVLFSRDICGTLMGAVWTARPPPMDRDGDAAWLHIAGAINLLTWPRVFLPSEV